MAVIRCIDCGANTGEEYGREPTLPGIKKPSRCTDCESKQRVGWMLKAIPGEGDRTFENMSEWEQEFSMSVRTQFARKGTLTEKQYQCLVRIYDKWKE